jgi:plasmid stabilization system protein ParE
VRTIIVRLQADLDIREIWAFIAKDNQSAADEIEAAIYSEDWQTREIAGNRSSPSRCV